MSITEYNNEKIVKQTYYRRYSGLIFYINNYNEHGQIIKQTFYHRDKTTIETIYEYDQNGDFVKITHYHLDGTINYFEEL
jgi:predicted metallo-beta-lactamase superfamily hydrolase